MKNIMLYILILVITAVSCKTEVSDDHDDHDHESVKLLLTEYTDQFELFAEVDPLVKGETTTILAHFTELKNFKPLKEGSITVSLIIGTKGIRQIVEKPVKPGIYRFALQPEVKGPGKLIFDINDENGNHKIVINDIVVYGDEHTAIHIAEKKEIENINTINFTKEQSWKIDFATSLPIYKPFGKVLKTTAHILPDQNDEIIVSSKTNGFVKFSGNILEGQKVNAGNVLLNISGSELADENTNVRFREAQNNYALSKANYDRNSALAKDKIISEKDLESAKAEYENAKVVFENLKKNFNVNGQIVASPKNGVVKHIFVTNGQYVEAGEALYSVSANQTLILKAEVQQKHFSALNSIYSANIKSAIDNKVYRLSDLKGKLISYGKSIDEDEGYLIPVNFQFENNEKFLTGSFVEVFIKTKTNKNALVIPNSALIEEQGNFFVFVQLTPELFEKREVKIGNSDGINTEIFEGLNNQERIVSKGAIIVKLAAVSNSLDPHAGHVH